MRKFGLMLVSVAGLTMLGAGAMADPAQTTTDTTQSAAPSADDNKTVCKAMPAPTGTRLGSRRECRTQKEWDMIAERARAEIERQQSNGFKTAQPGN